MPQPHLRTRSRKRLKVALSGGKKGTHYKKEKTSTVLCSQCNRPLTGIAHLTPTEKRKLNRSKRKVWRPYGGQICHNCLKNALKHAVRNF